MVLVTPRLVRPLDPDEVPPLPTHAGRSCRRRRAGAEAGKSGGRSPGPKEQTPMTDQAAARARGARGGLVHVALAMLALIAFSALAIDYGAMWVSRGQAQNAADAAALAGRTVAGVRRSGRRRRGPRPRGGDRRGETGLGRRAPRSISAHTLTSDSFRARRARPVLPTPASARRLPQRAARECAADVLRPDSGASRARTCARPRRPRSSPATPPTACGRGRSRTSGTRTGRTAR